MAFLIKEEEISASRRFFADPPSENGKIVEIEAAAIRPNPAQPRREFDTEALLALAESIRRHGILQPPVVRRITRDSYELIAGERRLRAALLCGMTTLPCLVREGEDDESAELAIVENLQRRDLNMFEEAGAIASLCDRFRLTQEQVGARLSVSQSYVANKLRLLRLSGKEREVVLTGRLTERHARAALRLPEERRLSALSRMAAEEMNVAAAEKLVDHLLAEKKGKPRHTGVIKDIRIFYNSVDRAIKLVREAGIGVRAVRRETEDEIELIVRIEKKQEKTPSSKQDR
ncbi:MAG: ParB/RepB/Spo0J family partition protein [Clostridia bacterium]|nr:ParB/RepB/Spo0J family partition protein [Clostridia bacterium]